MRPAASSPSSASPPRPAPEPGPTPSLKTELARIRGKMTAARGPVPEQTWIARQDAALADFCVQVGTQLDSQLYAALRVNKLKVSHPQEEVRAMYVEHVREQLLTGLRIEHPKAFAHRSLERFISNLGRSQVRRKDDIAHGQHALRLPDDDGESSARPDLDLLPAAVPLEDELVERELEQLLAQDLAGLPRPFRTALFMHGVMGMTYAEVAEKQGVGIDTVKSRIHRARALLRPKPCYQALLGAYAGKPR